MTALDIGGVPNGDVSGRAGAPTGSPPADARVTRGPAPNLVALATAAATLVPVTALVTAAVMAPLAAGPTAAPGTVAAGTAVTGDRGAPTAPDRAAVAMVVDLPGSATVDAVVGGGLPAAGAVDGAVVDGATVDRAVDEVVRELAAASPPGGLAPPTAAALAIRRDDWDVLDHDTRARLFETVERSPGTSLSAAAEAADVPLSTARYHVARLADTPLVETEKIRGKRRLFVGTMGDDRRELAAALTDEPTATLLASIAAGGEAGISQLAERLGRAPSTVSYHVDHLADAGLVDKRRDGDRVVASVAPVVASRLGSDAVGD